MGWYAVGSTGLGARGLKNLQSSTASHGNSCSAFSEDETGFKVEGRWSIVRTRTLLAALDRSWHIVEAKLLGDWVKDAVDV
jgi:hypothetical protein